MPESISNLVAIAALTHVAHEELGRMKVAGESIDMSILLKQREDEIRVIRWAVENHLEDEEENRRLDCEQFKALMEKNRDREFPEWIEETEWPASIEEVRDQVTCPAAFGEGIDIEDSVAADLADLHTIIVDLLFPTEPADLKVDKVVLLDLLALTEDLHRKLGYSALPK